MLKVQEHATVLTAENAKHLLGWSVVRRKEDRHFIDRLGRSVRCHRNENNRRFDAGLARDWMIEILRGRWQLNGETMIIDDLGRVQDGAHRLVALVWASQEVAKFPERWEHWHGREPHISCLIVAGIDHADDVINTIGVGKPRSLFDVLYRSEYFCSLHPRHRARVARYCSQAVKLLQHRTGYHAYGQRRPHTDSLDYLEAHPRIRECTSWIWEQRREIGRLLPPGYAVAMLYLAASSGSDPARYDLTDERLDWSRQPKAERFFADLFRRRRQMAPLREAVITLQVTGTQYRDHVCGLLAKGWRLHLSGQPLTTKSLRLQLSEDELGRLWLAENPTFGGIDLGHSAGWQTP